MMFSGLDINTRQITAVLCNTVTPTSQFGGSKIVYNIVLGSD